MLERATQKVLRRSAAATPRHLSFDSWDTLSADERQTVQVCHPQWRGVRTAAYAFGDPVVEVIELEQGLAEEMKEVGVGTVVVHASPPGTVDFLRRASALGLKTLQVFHSSMAQHGSDAGEAENVSTAIQMQSDDDLDGIGFVKIGIAEVFRDLGSRTFHVPNRVPRLPSVNKVPLGHGLDVGVFHDPYWRKNVTTQLGASALLGATAHVMRTPDVGYLEDISIVEHGTLAWEDFISLQASVDLNLYVTLSECHPMGPMESYLCDVPCLVSRTSELFDDDDELRELTTVVELDNPSAIAVAATRLLARAPFAIERARDWMTRHDRSAEQAWRSFTSM
ncbi:MAG: hypothetical protein BMS9Abin12_2377 [Acidimicrobiia bacterium]|nr:MAG: hypothetical protein BMS9Abin12_2377 [Acidimicrobiia bacterium]